MLYRMILLLFTIHLNAFAAPYFPPFDYALNRYGDHQLWFRDRFEKSSREDLKNHIWRNNFLKLSQKLYQLNSASPKKKSPSNPIPKVIHQIWLGGPIPEAYKSWIETWNHIPGWEYKLWTDNDAKNFGLANQELFDNAKNFGEQANILRYEILNRFGGLYVDVDMERLDINFFEFAHQNYDLYVAIEPLDHGVAICNAVIGSIPKHPLLGKMIAEMKTYQTATPASDLPPKANLFGPIYLSRKLLEYGVHKEETVDVILPPTFFYPFSLRDVVSKGLKSKNFIFPETVAVHWWDGSWLKPSGKIGSVP